MRDRVVIWGVLVIVAVMDGALGYVDHGWFGIPVYAILAIMLMLGTTFVLAVIENKVKCPDGRP